VTTRYFRWKGILRDRFDVLHVHWPEQIIRHRKAPVAFLKSLVFLLFLTRIRVQRKAIVRTVHNLRPHEEGTRLERFVLRRLERATTLWIVLNDATPTPSPGTTVTIEHGHYRDWYEEPSKLDTVRGRVLAFGMIRAYKGMDDLVRAFREVDDSALSLHICGRPDSDETTRVLTDLAGDDGRILLNLAFVPDETLASEIAAAEVVVLPYREVHNSGVALLALSMNRPVVVRRSASTELLAEEFGAEWVHLFDGDLSGSTISSALSKLRAAPREERVDMTTRDWTLLSQQLAQAYERAVLLAEGARRR
jgi:beta-1,4-mannosyltransferase